MVTKQEKKHLFYLDIALAISQHAKCLRGNFGAIIVKDDIIIGTGFNGPARKVPHCKECRRSDADPGIGYGKCISIHAELNAVINAGGRRECLGSVLYLDSHNRNLEEHYKDKLEILSCDHCARVMVNAGIEWLVYRVGDKPSVKHLPTLVKMGIIK